MDWDWTSKREYVEERREHRGNGYKMRTQDMGGKIHIFYTSRAILIDMHTDVE